MSEIHGKCSCGTVEFKFSTDALLAYQCHCSICRKSTGSAYSTTLIAPESDFVWIRGKDKVSSYSKDNGYKVNFCSCCGSPVPNIFREFPLFSVPVGSLDDAPEIEVVIQIYLGSRAKWDKDHFQEQKFVEMPSVNEMLEFLHVQVLP
jgi:hypothetical protein